MVNIAAYPCAPPLGGINIVHQPPRLSTALAYVQYSTDPKIWDRKRRSNPKFFLPMNRRVSQNWVIFRTKDLRRTGLRNGFQFRGKFLRRVAQYFPFLRGKSPGKAAGSMLATFEGFMPGLFKGFSSSLSKVTQPAFLTDLK